MNRVSKYIAVAALMLAGCNEAGSEDPQVETFVGEPGDPHPQPNDTIGDPDPEPSVGGDPDPQPDVVHDRIAVLSRYFLDHLEWAKLAQGIGLPIKEVVDGRVGIFATPAGLDRSKLIEVAQRARRRGGSLVAQAGLLERIHGGLRLVPDQIVVGARQWSVERVRGIAAQVGGRIASQDVQRGTYLIELADSAPVDAWDASARFVVAGADVARPNRLIVR